MKPALEQYFEDYGKRLGVALLNAHFDSMENLNLKNKTYASIIKMSKEEKPELNSERYLRTVKLFGKSLNIFPLKISRSGYNKNYITGEK